MHKEQKISIQYEYKEDLRALSLADNPTADEIEAAFAGMKAITPEIEQAYRRISAFMTSRKETPEILAVKVHFERSVLEILSALLLVNLSEMVLKYLGFSGYIEHINNVFLSGGLSEIKAVIGHHPTLAHYRNSANKTPLDIAMSERKLHPRIVKYLIGEEIKLSHPGSHIANMKNKPYDPVLERCINYCINAPIFISTSLLGKKFPAPVVQIINEYRGDKSPARWLQSGIDLVSVVRENWNKEKPNWKKANDLMDNGADIYTERVSCLTKNGLVVMTWHDSFSQVFLYPFGIPNSDMPELQVSFYEKIFLHAQERYTLLFLRKLIYDLKYLKYCEPTGRTRNIEKLFDILIKAKQDIFDIFMFAVRYNYTAIIQNILSKGLLHKIEINRKNDNNQTALQLAVAHGSDEIIRLVLEMKADINAISQDSPVGRTYCEDVHKIRLESKMDGFKFLLASHPEASRLGESVLHAAIRRINYDSLKQGCYEVISTLLELKADVNLKDRNNLTPLYLAATHKDSTIFQLFLKQDNGQLFEKFKQNYTPTFWGGLFGMGMKGRLKSHREEKISTMSGILDFLKKKEKEGERDTNTHKAVAQLKQQIASTLH